MDVQYVTHRLIKAEKETYVKWIVASALQNQLQNKNKHVHGIWNAQLNSSFRHHLIVTN